MNVYITNPHIHSCEYYIVVNIKGICTGIKGPLILEKRIRITLIISIFKNITQNYLIPFNYGKPY